MVTQFCPVFFGFDEKLLHYHDCQVTRIQVLNHPFDTISMHDLLHKLQQHIVAKEKITLAFSNPEHVLTYLQDTELQQYTNGCRYILPDGMGIVWASHLLKKENNNVVLKERITGTEFAEVLPSLCQQQKWRLCIFGGTKEISKACSTRLIQEYPLLKHLCIPGYGSAYTSAVSAIQNFQPDVLMVCMGNPKQERWIIHNLKSLTASVIFGNGGAVDFLSKTKKRAPQWSHRIGNLGFEWLWRLFQDFTLKRLLRIAKLPLFVWMVLVRKISQK